MKIVSRIVVLSVVLSILGMSLFGCSRETSKDVQTDTVIEQGKLVITIVDKTSKKPIGDATMVIMGTDNIYKTDDKGLSPEINLRINKDIYRKYGEKLLKKAPAGTVNILITKDGYKDCVIFNKSVYPGHAANRLKIELEKMSTEDKQDYVVDYRYPHGMWIEELIAASKEIKDEKQGEGECFTAVDVKDGKSKGIEDALVIMPELGLMIKTDKDGKGVLKPAAADDVGSLYPVKRNSPEYTVVVTKEGYRPFVMFNVVPGNEKNKYMNIVLKANKDGDKDAYDVSCQPYEDNWIKEIIKNCKNVSVE